MKMKIIPSLLIATVLGVGAYWYWSPFLALNNVKAAVKSGDAEAFNAHVDYPLLRENLKVQFASMIASKMPKGSSGMAGGLGEMFGQAMVSKMVDAMIQPQNVMAAMKQGQFGNKRPAAEPGQPANTPAPSTPTNDAEVKVEWKFDRINTDKLVAIAHDAKDPAAGKSIGLVFERAGFANWKLTDVRLPDMP